MRNKWIVIISRVLCLVLLFRIGFLSLYPIPSIISVNHSILVAKKAATNNYSTNFNLKASIEQLVNNINSILHFFKNRIAENKKLALSFWFSLINSIFLFASIYLNTKVNLFIWNIFRSVSLKKHISLCILRI